MIYCCWRCTAVSQSFLMPMNCVVLQYVLIVCFSIYYSGRQQSIPVGYKYGRIGREVHHIHTTYRTFCFSCRLFLSYIPSCCGGGTAKTHISICAYSGILRHCELGRICRNEGNAQRKAIFEGTFPSKQRRTVRTPHQGGTHRTPAKCVRASSQGRTRRAFQHNISS